MNVSEGELEGAVMPVTGRRAGLSILATAALVAATMAVVSPAPAAGISGGAITRVSVDAAGGDSDGTSSFVGVSDNGNFVAFVSAASDLVPDDTNGVADVFVRDVGLGTTSRVSVSSNGVQADRSSWGSVRR